MSFDRFDMFSGGDAPRNDHMYSKPSPYTEIYKVRIGKEVFIGTIATEDVNGNRQGCNDFITKVLEASRLYKEHKELVEALASSTEPVNVEVIDFAKTLKDSHEKFYRYSKEATIPYNPLNHVIEALSTREEEEERRKEK